MYIPTYMHLYFFWDSPNTKSQTDHNNPKRNSTNTNTSSSSPAYASGITRSAWITTSSPWRSCIVSAGFCRGRSFGSAQIMNQISTAITASWWDFSTDEIARLNSPNPNTAPIPNSQINTRSRDSIAPITCEYIPIISSKKLHEIPGKIIAQIAIIAEKIIIHHVGSTCVGESWVNPNATIAQMRRLSSCIDVNFPCFLRSKTIDHTTNPKKNPRTSWGYSVSAVSSTDASVTILTHIPPKSKRRKRPSTLFHASPICPLATHISVSGSRHRRSDDKSFS